MSNDRKLSNAYAIAKAIGYDVDDVLEAMQAKEQADAKNTAADDADRAAGNTVGMSRQIDQERQRHRQRPMRHASPGMAEAFQDHDDRRRQEQEQDRRRQAPATGLTPEQTRPAPTGIHPDYAKKQRDIAAQEAEHRAAAARQWEARQSEIAIQRAEQAAVALEIQQEQEELRARRRREAEEARRNLPGNHHI